MKILPAAPWTLLFVATALGSALCGQDVTVGPPGWFQAEGAPDVAPRPRRQLRVAYPEELRERGTGEAGYVLVSRYLDTRGRSRVLEIRSPYPWFKQAVEESAEGWDMAPARRGEKPVNVWFWQPIIFNPASASPDGPDATPRLLAVTPVIVPAAVMRKLRENSTAWGTVRLDAGGVPTAVTLEPGAPEHVLPFIEQALKDWRFAPARRDGHPFPAEMRVAFLLYPPMAPVSARETLPRPVKQEAPVYPYAMRQAGFTGEVVVGFVITTRGDVVDAVVVRSNNPAFDEPALDAVLGWKFEPATVDGWPVNIRMRVPIVFRFNDGAGQEAITVRDASKRAREHLPPDLQYDVAPRPLGFVVPVYPYALLRADREGEATAAFLVGRNGRVEELSVAQATAPEFGLALAAAVETFEFAPALRDGRATATVVKMTQKFADSGDPQLVSDEDRKLLRLESRRPEAIIGAERLDGPLRARSRRAPVFPLALRATLRRGEAEVEFLVDEEGHARLPRVVRASDPAFGYAAAQAVAQWLFDPPIAHGKAVVARVVVPFEFELEPPVMGTGVGEPRAEGEGK